MSGDAWVLVFLLGAVIGTAGYIHFHKANARVDELIREAREYHPSRWPL